TEVTPQGDPSVVVVHPDGSGRTTIARHAANPLWSPNGRWLLYWKTDGDRPTLEIADSTASYAAVDVHPDYRTMHWGDVYRGEASSTFWAPDSKSIWLHVGATLARVWLPGSDADPGLPRLDGAADWGSLTITRGPDLGPNATNVGGIAFSPDGRQV